MSDDIRSLSEALAVDPASLAFLRLAELLRQSGDLALAWRVATRGLERHPQRVDAHDLVARVASDRGDIVRAKEEWEMVLALEPEHTGAQKGLGFLAFRQGDLESANRYLSAAIDADPRDQTVATALRTVRLESSAATREATPRASKVITPPAGEMQAPAAPFAPKAAEARTLFSDVMDSAAHSALLLDGDGYVVAGEHVGADGTDRGADIGAQLSGVSDEANRAMRHLGLGAWRQIVFESELANVAMAPAGTGLLLVTAPRGVPLGLMRRLLERALERTRRWLESGT